ncbi:MAG: ATP-binding cassette domain-containing protein [Alphaproteobacteria bacterium]|jgi:peptide/nickel transport system ATP-binding protein|nr:ATP-binding cassette domain-containing protein [Alphaproteobacteria bacterium]
MTDAAAPILEARDLSKHFGGGRRLVGGRAPVVKAVDGVDLTIPRGRTLGIVGESGCGKSTLGRMLVGLLEPTAGTIRLDGRPVTGLKGDERLAFHRKVQLVFQDPLSSLNPRKTVRQILEGPLEVLAGMDKPRRAERVAELMDLVSLRPEFVDRYPHEFSGGQCQRIGVARALACEPQLIVLDEPVSALDVSVQAQVLKLLKDLQQRLGLTYVFISHDLAVVENLADDVMVMYFGRVVEHRPRRELFRAPQHDYTKLLLSSVPVPGEKRAVTAAT